jgi:hypothetical protein
LFADLDKPFVPRLDELHDLLEGGFVEDGGTALECLADFGEGGLEVGEQVQLLRVQERGDRDGAGGLKGPALLDGEEDGVVDCEG